MKYFVFLRPWSWAKLRFHQILAQLSHSSLPLKFAWTLTSQCSRHQHKILWLLLPKLNIAGFSNRNSPCQKLKLKRSRKQWKKPLLLRGTLRGVVLLLKLQQLWQQRLLLMAMMKLQGKLFRDNGSIHLVLWFTLRVSLNVTLRIDS